MTVLSLAPQRNEKKKEKDKGSQSFLNQGDPRCYPRVCDLLKSKISLAAHLANNTPLSVINFEWDIKGAYWRDILTKQIQLLSNCIATSFSLHQGKVF